MKKNVLICCLLGAMLLGCTYREGDGEAVLQDPSASVTVESAPGVASGDAAAARIAYYEALVQELQEEVLELKTELYAARVSYEERIALLTGKGSEADESAFEYEIKNGKATLTAYRGASAELTLPQTLGGYPLEAIGEGAFEGNAALCVLVLPEGVREVGWFAFSGCVSLVSVHIPKSVQSIGYAAFNNCKSSLTVVTPKGSYAADYAESYGVRVSFFE